MQEYRVRMSQRLRPLPPGRWQVNQRWNDLFYAHWPVKPAFVASLVPDGLQVDTHNGMAWIGVVQLWTERIKLHGLPPIPGARCFPELSLYLYVRERHSGAAGVWPLSKESNNLLGATIGRLVFGFPYHWAEMELHRRGMREFSFYSRRRLSRETVIFESRFRALGPSARLAVLRPGSLEHFFYDRYCLFTRNRRGELVRAFMHPISGPLEEAEAEIGRNDLLAAVGLAGRPVGEPVFHFTRRMVAYIWPPELLAVQALQPIMPAAVSPSRSFSSD